jgi:hypothetical protein
MQESKRQQNGNLKVSQSSKCKGTRQEVYSYVNNGPRIMVSLNTLSSSMVMIIL